VERYARAFWYPPYECAYINAGGVKAEVIPQIAKKQVAIRLHTDDWEDLMVVAKNYKQKVEH
ncbi:MAG: hypothetical protein WCE54_21635, partial [Ignavibacteriaceae bacterium]